jgi:CubicO group peptidase (beta-lactamase class C family)
VRYREFLNQRVLDPLGMDATFDPRGARRTIVPVEGVGVDNRIIRFLMLRYLAGAALPGGGLFGTLDDLIRFGAALLRPRQIDGRVTPISSATFELMAQDQLHGVPGMYDGEERPVHHGLGWGKPTLMHDLPGSPRVVSHGGASGTRLWIDPEAGLVFVYFTNRWAADRAAERDALIGTYQAIARA